MEQPPAEVAYLWPIFAELHTTRANNGFGVCPIAYAEIDAWCRLNDRHLSPFEVSAIKRIDAAFMTSEAKKAKTK